MATYCQMEEPVNPTTVSTPSALASRAVCFISSAARVADAFGVAVAPDFGPDDCLVAEVDGVIADGLALEVVGDGPDLEVVLVQDSQLGLDVAGFVPAPGVQVVAGDGDFQAVVAPAGGQFGDFLEGQVGPLAGEQGERAGHGQAPSVGVVAGG